MLVRETVFGAEVVPTATVPNASTAGLRVSGRLPVPVSATVCGESGALSLIASEPEMAPPMEGVKVTVAVHVAPAANVEPQVLLATAKLPVAVIELMLTEAELVFFKVTAFGELVVPPIAH